jgi:O-acetylhomoserine/O-acetylserine sulfhydrylase-like pyridoxal-dependent enzyme
MATIRISPSLPGITTAKFHETFGGLAYIIKARVDGLRDLERRWPR